VSLFYKTIFVYLHKIFGLISYFLKWASGKGVIAPLHFLPESALFIHLCRKAVVLFGLKDGILPVAQDFFVGPDTVRIAVWKAAGSVPD